MWLIGACVGVAVVIVLLVAVLYAESKDEAQRQKAPSIMYIYNNTHGHDGPGLYERSRGGQRPFGENSRTRRSEREKARGDHSYY